MAQEKRPYHVQAIYDLEADYSPEHFRLAIGECRSVIAQVIAEDDSSDQQVARVRILRYLDLQLSRAVSWAAAEADLMAVVLRSQIELRGRRWWALLWRWKQRWFASLERPQRRPQPLTSNQQRSNETGDRNGRSFPSGTYGCL